MTCCAEKREIFFFAGGLLVVCSWGELSDIGEDRVEKEEREIGEDRVE